MAVDRLDVIVDSRPASWRKKNSRWIWVVGLGAGAFSFIGWIWAANKVKDRHMWIVTAFWTGMTVPLYIAISLASPEGDPDNIWDTIGTILMMIVWVGGLAHAFIRRNSVLRAVAAREEEMQRMRDGMLAGPRPANSSTPGSPETSPLSGLGVSTSQYYGSVPAPGPSAAGTTRAATQPSVPSSTPTAAPAQANSQATSGAPSTVDINAASASSLRVELRIDEALADRIVAHRNVHGPYRDLTDLAARASLQPHQIRALDGRLTFSGPSTPHRGQGGRRLDL